MWDVTVVLAKSCLRTVQAVQAVGMREAVWLFALSCHIYSPQCQRGLVMQVAQVSRIARVRRVNKITDLQDANGAKYSPAQWEINQLNIFHCITNESFVNLTTQIY